MSFGNFPAATPALPPPFPAQTQQDLLDVLGEVWPDHYLAPLRDIGPGYELPQAYAKMLAFASVMVEYLASGSFILSAEGPAKAQVNVRFLRQNALAGAVTVKKGTILVTPATGREFVTLEDAVFGGADVGPITVRAEARFYGWAYNVKGPVTLPTGEVLEGEISRIKLPLQDPVYADPTIYVEQVDDATGGKLGFLDALGKDRGITRLPGEPDDAYRVRVRALPDTVTPDAISRVIKKLLAPYGATPTLIETWSPAYQTCYDAPNATFGYMGALYDPNLFCFDDPRITPFRNRWLDETDRRGAFIVSVPRIGPILDVGMAYDDTATGYGGLQNPIGARGVGAWDVPTDANENLVQAGYDGFDRGVQAVYKGLFDVLQEIKAGGVSATVELEGE